MTASAPAESLGRFRLDGVPPGTYTITLSRVGSAPVSIIVPVSVDQPVDLGDIQIGDPAILRGTVFRSSSTPGLDDTPLQGAQVKVYVLSQYPTVVAQSVITGADGTFVFTGLVAPESYIVEFSFPAGAPAQATRLVNNPPLQPNEDRDITTINNDPSTHIKLTTG